MISLKHVALSLVCLVSTLVQVTNADAVLEVLLSRFINPYRQTANRSAPCDNNNRFDPCETYFLLCAVDKPFKNPQNCSYGFYQTDLQGDNDLTWKVGDTLYKEKNLTNPIQFYIPGSILQSGATFPREAKFGLKIVVYDDDSSAGVRAQDLVDFFQFDGAHIPLAQDEPSAKFITVFPQSIINDYTQYTQLRLRIRLYCAKDYYGIGCERFCTEYGNFQCSSEGVLGCKPGWGPAGNCTQPLTSCATVPAPCRNGATCSDNGDKTTVTCQCAPGYEGKFCELDIKECDAEPCQNNGFCQEVRPPAFHCICLKGFTGKLCEQIVNPCLAEDGALPCQNGGVCNMTQPGNYECSCPIGYEGTNCQNEMDECKSSPCLNDGICVDLVSGYKCVCQPTFAGDRCEKVINECDKNPCFNNATCNSVRPGVYTCSCMPGYGGPKCDELEDTCNPSPCLNSAKCVQDGPASFECVCPPGLSGPRCEFGSDVCAKKNCQNGGSCVVINGPTSSARCECKPGFIGGDCEYEANNCEFQVCPSESSICTQKDDLFILCIDSTLGVLVANYTIQDIKDGTVTRAPTEPPIFTSRPIEEKMTLAVGESLILSCKNSGLFKPFLKRADEVIAIGLDLIAASPLFKGLMVQMLPDHSVFMYKIGPLSTLHSGSYSCESDGLNIKQIFSVLVSADASTTASTGNGGSASTTISGTTPPTDPSITTLSVEEGGMATFDCAALQSDVLEFIRVDDQKTNVIARNTIIFNYTYTNLIIGGFGSIFKLDPVRRVDAGFYDCDNSVFTKNFRLIVNSEGEENKTTSGSGGITTSGNGAGGTTTIPILGTTKEGVSTTVESGTGSTDANGGGNENGATTGEGGGGENGNGSGGNTIDNTNGGSSGSGGESGSGGTTSGSSGGATDKTTTKPIKTTAKPIKTTTKPGSENEVIEKESKPLGDSASFIRANFILVIGVVIATWSFRITS